VGTRASSFLIFLGAKRQKTTFFTLFLCIFDDFFDLLAKTVTNSLKVVRGDRRELVWACFLASFCAIIPGWGGV